MLADIGVLPGSSRYYHEADSFTESCLYFTPHAGDYRCNREYEVARDHLDVCQLILVEEGQLYVEYNGESYVAPAGSLVLLDCRRPHRYTTGSDELHMRWFHFVGAGSEAYTNLILQTRGVVLPVDPEGKIQACMSDILAAAQQQDMNVHMTSVHIHTLLALLVQLPGQLHRSDIEQVIDRSAAYIETHYGDADLSNESLAHMSALSSCYFIRQFKNIRGITPHQYIQAVRIRSARQMLTTTSRSIEDIADICGFSNASHFIMVFKRMTGITPLQFRMMWR
ncbi:MAG: AraC family transcriptional regulator [Butyricicoccus porcorum]